MGVEEEHVRGVVLSVNSALKNFALPVGRTAQSAKDLSARAATLIARAAVKSALRHMRRTQDER